MSAVGVGSAVSLITTTMDAAGAAVDPLTVTLRVLRPDGTEAGPYTWESGQVVREALGRFSYRYVTSQAGQHISRWETVTPTAVDEEPFDVAPRWGETGMVSLEDAKAHLKRTTAVDDVKLSGFILAATDLIEDRMGRIMPVTVTEDVYSRGRTIVLRERPVIEVAGIVTLPDETVVAPYADGSDGWRLTSVEGVVESRARFGGDLRITYRAGRQPLPARFRLAALELVAHLFRTSQLNAEGGRPGLVADVQVTPGAGFALPYNVRQLLGLDKAHDDMPVIG